MDDRSADRNLLRPARLDELRATALLDSPPEEGYDRFTRLATVILKTPVSLLSLVDGDRQFFKSSLGLQEPWASRRQTPLSHSFCQHVVDSAEPLSVVDARIHPLLKDNLAVTDLGVVAYLGIPITTSKGHTLGSFCAIDTQPRQWTADEVAILEDLTALLVRQIEFRLLAQQLHEDYLGLRRLELFRDEMVQMLVHDLRNPLTSFLGGLGLTQQHGGLTQTQHRYIEIARNGGKNLLQMVNSLLDIRSAEDQQINVIKSECNPDKIIQTACEQMAPLAEQAAVTLTWDTQENLSCWADADKLRRVIVNLVSNAIQHTPAGGKVLVFAKAEEGQEVLFSVIDTGKGIAKADRSNLFERIDRPKSKDAKDPSSGLGLPFSKLAIEAHGGRIWMDSELGHGTSFYFTIPVATQPKSPPS
jgi:signal transduction histidine kinase